MKYFVSAITLTALLGTSACGYFLHPERVGQKSGKIDPTIVLLDAAGLLIGILPGVVAFAVDITTGAIYLAPGQKSVIDKHKNRLSNIEHLQLEPVARSELGVDPILTAEQVSALLDRPIDPAAIEYYRPAANETTVLAQRAERGYRDERTQ